MHGIPALPSSAPVRTASTPGAAFAALVSMPRMRACAWGERSTKPWTWFGRLMSSL